MLKSESCKHGNKWIKILWTYPSEEEEAQHFSSSAQGENNNTFPSPFPLWLSLSLHRDTLSPSSNPHLPIDPHADTDGQEDWYKILFIAAFLIFEIN